MEELKKIWSVYDSDLFRIRTEIMEKKYKGYCYAGEWTFTANLETGEIKQCHYERVLGNLYEDKELTLCAVGNHCHSEYCYACHAFLLFGVIPKLNFDIYYDDVRNRKDAGWLSKEMQQFMHQRLFDNNKLHTIIKKKIVNQKNKDYERSQYQPPLEFSNQVIAHMKNQPLKANYVIVEARHLISIMYQEIPKELLWINHIYNDVGKKGSHITNANSLTIRALQKSSSSAEGDEIWIVGLLADDVWYDAEDIFESKWLKRNRMLGWRSYDNSGIENEIIGYLPEGSNQRLVLEKNRWRGICMVSYHGQDFEVDTYDSCDDDILYITLN